MDAAVNGAQGALPPASAHGATAAGSGGAVSVSVLAPDDRAACSRWDAYVQQAPQATFFHRAGWLRVVHRVFGHPVFLLAAERQGRIVGVLPLAQIKSLLFGHAVVSAPFAVYGGVVADDEAAAAALEAQAQGLTQKLGADHLELRYLQARHPEWPLQDLYVTFRKTLAADEEANMLAIPRKQRAMVRKGIKNQLRSELDEGVDRFFAVYADNVHRHGTPAMPKRWFQALRDEFGQDCRVLTVVSPEGAPLSSVLSFYFRNEVLPYYAGDMPAARDLAANDFKYWELMRRSCTEGIEIFDYGRSKIDTGPYAFKKNWGFEPTPLHYEFQLYKRESVPQNNPNNAKYKMLIEGWRRMPLGLANTIGPWIVRSLG